MFSVATKVITLTLSTCEAVPLPPLLSSERGTVQTGVHPGASLASARLDSIVRFVGKDGVECPYEILWFEWYLSRLNWHWKASVTPNNSQTHVNVRNMCIYFSNREIKDLNKGFRQVDTMTGKGNCSFVLPFIIPSLGF